jgi:NAD(P)-dependent dehydrogenase (short-subunit alcohol dehydrogenase family)
MTFDLSGKTVLVTGGNGGIGLGMAQGLAEAGADLVVWGSNAEKLARARDMLAAPGRRVLAQRCDVADESQVEARFREALAETGRIDACFANAGVSQKRAALHELSTEEWRRVMSVNLDGAFFTLRAASRHMVERAKAGDPGGRLVVVASTAAVHGAARAAAYAATKGALVAMTRALAVEMARYTVTANAILPGWIETEMTAAASPTRSSPATSCRASRCGAGASRAILPGLWSISRAMRAATIPATASSSTAPTPSSRVPGCSLSCACSTSRTSPSA